MFAEAAAPPPEFASRTAEWLACPQRFPLNRLSATAVQTYEICPLQFKLEREWRIPGKFPLPCSMAPSIHRVLTHLLRFGPRSSAR